MTAPTHFEYSHWRHGGWYVHDVRYPSGACGCVSRNYPDKKWRIACDPRPFDTAPTFKTRDDAARAEWEMVRELCESPEGKRQALEEAAREMRAIAHNAARKGTP